MKRRWMVSSAITVCCAACFASLANAAATPAEMPVNGAVPTPVRASLQIEAASARYRLTDTTTLFLKGFDDEGSKVLEPVLSVKNGNDEDKFWSDLMAGALQVRHQSGDSGLTLWFNPVFDAGLAVQWKIGAGQWQPDAAWWVLGQDIRNGAAGKAEASSAAVASPAAIAQQNGETVFMLARAKDWQPPHPSQEADRIVRERVTAARGSLKKLQTSGHGSAVYWATKQLLTLGEPRAWADGPKVKPVLAAFGPDARRRLRVVSAAPTSGHAWVLAMQSPDAPAMAIFVTSSNVNAVSIALVDLKLLRFNKQENSHE